MITAFVKQPWNLLLILIIVGLLWALLWLDFFWRIWAAPRVGSANDSVSLVFVPVAMVGGFLAGSLVKLFRHGRAQRSLKRANSWWLEMVLAIAWLLLGIFALDGGTDRSMSDLSQALTCFMFALMSVLLALVKPAITTKGIRARAFDLIEWKQVKSYEWQGNKLVLHLKARFLPRWLAESSLKVVPDEQEVVNHFLKQHLPDQQLQPPAAVQTSA